METKEHVLDAVGEVKNTNRRSPARFRQRVKEHLLTLQVDVLGLKQKRVLGDHAFVQSGSVLGHTERRERALLLGQINGVGNGMRDRQGGVFRVDLNGRDVKPDVRPLPEQQKTGDSLDRESLAGIGIAYILETIGSLLDLAEAGVEVADSVGHRQIFGIIFKDLFVFRDGALQLALLDILLRSAEDLLLVESETKRHI